MKSHVKQIVAALMLSEAFSPNNSASAFTVSSSNNVYHSALHINTASSSSDPLFLIPEQAAELVEAAKDYAKCSRCNGRKEDDLQVQTLSRQTKISSTTLSPKNTALVSGRNSNKGRGVGALFPGLFAKNNRRTR